MRVKVKGAFESSVSRIKNITRSCNHFPQTIRRHISVLPPYRPTTHTTFQTALRMCPGRFRAMLSLACHPKPSSVSYNHASRLPLLSSLLVSSHPLKIPHRTITLSSVPTGEQGRRLD